MLLIDYYAAAAMPAAAAAARCLFLADAAMLHGNMLRHAAAAFADTPLRCQRFHYLFRLPRLMPLRLLAADASFELPPLLPCAAAAFFFFHFFRRFFFSTPCCRRRHDYFSRRCMMPMMLSRCFSRYAATRCYAAMYA